MADTEEKAMPEGEPLTLEPKYTEGLALAAYQLNCAILDVLDRRLGSSFKGEVRAELQQRAQGLEKRGLAASVAAAASIRSMLADGLNWRK